MFHTSCIEDFHVTKNIADGRGCIVEAKMLTLIRNLGITQKNRCLELKKLFLQHNFLIMRKYLLKDENHFELKKNLYWNKNINL